LLLFFCFFEERKEKTKAAETAALQSPPKSKGTPPLRLPFPLLIKNSLGLEIPPTRGYNETARPAGARVPVSDPL